MSYQSDVAKVKGLGSAKHGFSHWWMQRMTAVLLVPTGLFVLISLLRLDALSAQSMVVWAFKWWLKIMSAVILGNSYFNILLSSA